MHLRGVRPNPGTGRPGRSGAGSQRDRPRRLSRLAAIKREIITITERTRRSIPVVQSTTGNATSRSKAPRRPTACGCMSEACDHWWRKPLAGPDTDLRLLPVAGLQHPHRANERGCLDCLHRACAR